MGFDEKHVKASAAKLSAAEEQKDVINAPMQSDTESSIRLGCPIRVRHWQQTAKKQPYSMEDSERHRLKRLAMDPAVRKAKDDAGNAKRNKILSQACTHQAMVRKLYPEAFLASNIDRPALVAWITAHRGQPCKYCQSPSMSIDHIVSLKNGGPHSWDNLQLICNDCNSVKRHRTEEQFLAWIAKLKAL